MPKIKTHRGAAKRFKVAKSGRIKYQKINRRHILTKKSTKRKRQLRETGYLTGTLEKNMKDLLPYS